MLTVGNAGNVVEMMETDGKGTSENDSEGTALSLGIENDSEETALKLGIENGTDEADTSENEMVGNDTVETDGSARANSEIELAPTPMLMVCVTGTEVGNSEVAVNVRLPVTVGAVGVVSVIVVGLAAMLVAPSMG